ncbi:MAG: putative biopolymer transport protein [Gemmatimonadetes bacterium]|nr:putative biopolymer transport protein [Gemmatimonadota bacterium]
MAFTSGGSGGLTNEINVTPMIDVLLVLLIIFMAAIPTMRKTVDVQLPDPTPALAPPGSQSNQIVLEVSPEGYSINTEKVDDAHLGPRLKEIYDGRPEKVIFVKGSPDVKYEKVVHAMDVSRGSGVKVIGVPPKDIPGAGK